MQQGRYAARLIQRRVTDRPALNAAAPIQMTPLRNARLNASADASVASLLLMSSSIRLPLWPQFFEAFGARSSEMWAAMSLAIVNGGGKFDSCGGRKSDSRQPGLAAG
jgi:hypothetical protein